MGSGAWTQVCYVSQLYCLLSNVTLDESFNFSVPVFYNRIIIIDGGEEIGQYYDVFRAMPAFRKHAVSISYYYRCRWPP